MSSYAADDVLRRALMAFGMDSGDYEGYDPLEQGYQGYDPPEFQRGRMIGPPGPSGVMPRPRQNYGAPPPAYPHPGEEDLGMPGSPMPFKPRMPLRP